MEERFVTRREAIRTTAAAGMLLPFFGALPAAGADPEPSKAPPPRLNLGLAGYSLRKLSTNQAVAALQLLQIPSVTVFRVHVPILLSTPEICREATQKFRDAGIRVAGTGVVTLANDEAVHRRAFECGKAAGLDTMTASYAEPPDAAALEMTERFVREYDIRIAFHNHGPEDRIFPSPLDVWKAVEPYDERLGLCIDVGHSARAGVDPAEAIRKCRTRLYDLHLKDSRAPAGARKDVPVGLGFGHLDIRGILSALMQVDYRHQVGLEDEVEAEDPIPGVAQSFGYMRGLLCALSQPAPL